MIEVKVRHVEEGEAAHLGWFTLEEIPQIPNLFKAFSSYLDLEHEELYLMFVQFVIDVDEVYFEIVVGEDCNE